ncbi:MAG: MBL fold metallo-hydrolase [Tidjanibacter sp.]|nr:MBL fold metallo-hydrolase [Tidjanibacter sp.]
MLKLTFLGTGTSQGVPMIGCHCAVCHSADPRDKRLRSSAMIENNDTRVVIDAGPDFRYQMLRAGVDNIDAILLTHQHTDHIMGLDDVRAFNYFCRKSIVVCATEEVERVVRKNFDYAFEEKPYPGAPKITLQRIDTEPFTIGSMEIVPIRGRHFTLPVTGYRIGPIAYLTDFNHIESEELEKLKGVEVLVINALRHEPHISHFTLDEATEIARKVGATKSYFTHMSHQIGLHAEQEPQLPEGMFMAYDTLTIEIPSNK